MRMKQKFTSAALALVLLASMVLTAVPARAATVSGWDRVTEGQRNIVRRAYQMTLIEWTPVADITGWRGKFTYKAGTTYTGLPYSQPLKGKYVPFKATLEEFIAAVNDPNSQLYQVYKDSQNGYITMPYFGADCASFVAWAWNVPQGNTRSLPQYSTKLSSYKDMQIGDGLIAVGDHATLITDITYDASGNITHVEICDSNAYDSGGPVYWCQKKTYTLDKFLSKFINNSSKNYAVYRVNGYESVPYTHSCAIPLEGDSCAKCGLNYYAETACSFTATVDMSATVYKLPTNDSATTGILFAGSMVQIKAYHVADDGRVWYKTTDDGWLEAERVTTDCAHKLGALITITNQPTCTQGGSGIYSCTKCMGNAIGAVKALGHSYSGGVCTRCGAVHDPDAVVPGDTDMSGTLDTNDAVYLLLHIMFGSKDYPVSGDAALDFDGTGTIGTDDAVYLLLHVMFGDGDYPLYV